MAVTEQDVLSALKSCYDPEIPVNIVDLGLIYGVNLAPASDDKQDVTVDMTLTAQGCPEHIGGASAGFLGKAAPGAGRHFHDLHGPVEIFRQRVLHLLEVFRVLRGQYCQTHTRCQHTRRIAFLHEENGGGADRTRHSRWIRFVDQVADGRRRGRRSSPIAT